MLDPVIDVLETQRIILASGSPRRQEMLRSVGLKFIVVPSRYEEDLKPEDNAKPEEYVMTTAMKKVEEVSERLNDQEEKYDLIIAADTIVYKDNKIFGKPKNEEEAFKVLQSLSGECHTVYSGVCIKSKEKTITFSESTNVTFGKLPDDVLKAYVKTGESLDKAGGYGIQVRGGTFIERIEGDYYNIVGLPLFRLCKHLYELYTPKF